MISTTTYRPQSLRPANGGYRYFFNGQESDGEVYGEGGFQNYGFRMYDTRIARFWSVDPLAGKFPWNSTYAFAENRVLDGVNIKVWLILIERHFLLVADYSRMQRNKKER